MKSQHRLLRTAVLAATLLAFHPTGAEDRRFEPTLTLAARAGDPQDGPVLVFANPGGLAATYNIAGTLDRGSPFFQQLGTNGRSCDTCHQASEGWTVTPAGIQARFDATDGTDPIFRLNDGANSPRADVATVEARQAAYSMLLTKGLIRVGIGIPPNAEFELVAVDDPYGHASAAELSLFRRPLPTTNLKFLSTVMWDGRETFTDPAAADCLPGTQKCFAPMHFNLANLANDATVGHAEATQPLTQALREAIVRFQGGLFTAQVFDRDAGYLGGQDTRGGPLNLAVEPYHFGINDVVAGDFRTGAPFDARVFTLYDGWANGDSDQSVPAKTGAARAAIARGQALFNTKPIRIEGVKGLNDDLGVPVLAGTCTTCHDTPNSGNHSIPAPLDIGLTDASRRTPDLPLYRLRNKTTGVLQETSDPGRALITGRWSDIGRFKGPILRGLAARAPYFHNGSATDLGAAVDFYNQRFSIGFSTEERADLVAFLRAL